MTTPEELGAMLIEVGKNGRKLQRADGTGSWEDVHLIDDFSLGDIEANEEYRLKPKVRSLEITIKDEGGVRMTFQTQTERSGLYPIQKIIEEALK